MNNMLKKKHLKSKALRTGNSIRAKTKSCLHFNVDFGQKNVKMCKKFDFRVQCKQKLPFR